MREKDRAYIGAELTCCWLCRFGDRILSSFSARLGPDIVILGRKTEDGLMLQTLNVAPRDLKAPESFWRWGLINDKLGRVLPEPTPRGRRRLMGGNKNVG